MATEDWVPVFNSASSDVPPFGVMASAAQGFTPDGSLIIGQPTDTSQADVLFNGLSPIPAGGYGQGTRKFPCPAAYDDDAEVEDGSPIGTVPGLWVLSPLGDGFSCWGPSYGVCNIVPRQIQKVFYARLFTVQLPAYTLSPDNQTITYNATGTAPAIDGITPNVGDVVCYNPCECFNEVQAATNSSPIQITSAGHNLSTGAVVEVDGGSRFSFEDEELTGVGFPIVVIDANNFTLTGSVADGSYDGTLENLDACWVLPRDGGLWAFTSVGGVGVAPKLQRLGSMSAAVTPPQIVVIGDDGNYYANSTWKLVSEDNPIVIGSSRVVYRNATRPSAIFNYLTSDLQTLDPQGADIISLLPSTDGWTIYSIAGGHPGRRLEINIPGIGSVGVWFQFTGSISTGREIFSTAGTSFYLPAGRSCILTWTQLDPAAIASVLPFWVGKEDDARIANIGYWFLDSGAIAADAGFGGLAGSVPGMVTASGDFQSLPGAIKVFATTILVDAGYTSLGTLTRPPGINFPYGGLQRYQMSPWPNPALAMGEVSSNALDPGIMLAGFYFTSYLNGSMGLGASDGSNFTWGTYDPNNGANGGLIALIAAGSAGGGDEVITPVLNNPVVIGGGNAGWGVYLKVISGGGSGTYPGGDGANVANIQLGSYGVMREATSGNSIVASVFWGVDGVTYNGDTVFGGLMTAIGPGPSTGGSGVSPGVVLYSSAGGF